MNVAYYENTVAQSNTKCNKMEIYHYNVWVRARVCVSESVQYNAIVRSTWKEKYIGDVISVLWKYSVFSLLFASLFSFHFSWHFTHLLFCLTTPAVTHAQSIRISFSFSYNAKKRVCYHMHTSTPINSDEQRIKISYDKWIISCMPNWISTVSVSVVVVVAVVVVCSISFPLTRCGRPKYFIETLGRGENGRDKRREWKWIAGIWRNGLAAGSKFIHTCFRHAHCSGIRMLMFMNGANYNERKQQRLSP